MNRKVLRKNLMGLSILGLMVFCGNLSAQSVAGVDDGEIIEECFNDKMFTDQVSGFDFTTLSNYEVVNNAGFILPNGFTIEGKSVLEVAQNTLSTNDTYFVLNSVDVTGERATISYEFHYMDNGIAKSESVEATLGVFNQHWSTMESTFNN